MIRVVFLRLNHEVGHITWDGRRFAVAPPGLETVLKDAVDGPGGKPINREKQPEEWLKALPRKYRSPYFAAVLKGDHLVESRLMEGEWDVEMADDDRSPEEKPPTDKPPPTDVVRQPKPEAVPVEPSPAKKLPPLPPPFKPELKTNADNPADPKPAPVPALNPKEEQEPTKEQDDELNRRMEHLYRGRKVDVRHVPGRSTIFAGQNIFTVPLAGYAWRALPEEGQRMWADTLEKANQTGNKGPFLVASDWAEEHGHHNAASLLRSAGEEAPLAAGKPVKAIDLGYDVERPDYGSGLGRQFITLDNGERGVFIPHYGSLSDLPEQIQLGYATVLGRHETREVLAWQLAAMFGISHLVPPAVMRVFTTGQPQWDDLSSHPTVGALQKYEPGVAGWKQNDALAANSKDMALGAAFDFVLGNLFRSSSEWFKSPQGLKLIGHAWTFPSSNEEFLTTSRQDLLRAVTTLRSGLGSTEMNRTAKPMVIPPEVADWLKRAEPHWHHVTTQSNAVPSEAARLAWRRLQVLSDHAAMGYTFDRLIRQFKGIRPSGR